MNSVNIFGLKFSLDNKEDVVLDILKTGSGDLQPMKLLITPNVDHVVMLHKNPLYRNACGIAWKLTIDGFPLQLLIRILGTDNPPRVTGADLFPDLMNSMRPGTHRPGFVVASQNSAEYLKKYLLAKGYSGDGFYISVPDFGFERDDAYKCEVIDGLNKINCTHLYMGVGAPKSEIWAYENRDKLQGICVMCFGAGIEFFSKQLKRAPVWMQKNGLEWLWRLCSEPRRLAKRYVINSWLFLFYSAKEIARQKKIKI